MTLPPLPRTNGYNNGRQRFVDPHAIEGALSPVGSTWSGQAETHTLQIDVKDWDLLFEAIQSRLCATVLGQRNGLTAGFDVAHTADKVRDCVLDSVSALEKLHRALHQERSLHHPP